tara:strand:+ start:198 stop:437 length:240 start_codon:yes stop_codon:yes gene_type:complete
MTTIEQLQAIFRDVFDDEDLSVNADTTANDIDEWDSLAHIRLILQIEKSFSLHFDASEIEKLENVGQMSELISLRQAND